MCDFCKYIGKDNVSDDLLYTKCDCGVFGSLDAVVNVLDMQGKAYLSLAVIPELPGREIPVDEKEINFCPICGRQLNNIMED